MKKTILLILLACTSLAHAQDYVTCTYYNELGDFVKAKTCITDLKSKYPTDPSYYFYSMLRATGANDQEEATRLMALNASFPSDNYHAIAAKTIYLVYNKDLSQAKAVFDPVLKNHKTASAQVLLNVAIAFVSYKAKEPEYTLMWLNLLEKELKAPHAGWLMAKGDYFASVGDHGNALNFYNKVLDVEPKNSVAMFKKAIAYRRIKNPDAAIIELEEALKTTPTFPYAILEMGELLFELNRPEEGMKYYNKYFEMVPTDTYSRLRLGSSLFSLKKYAEAEQEADKVLQVDPKNVSALKLKSYTSFELGIFPQGQSMLEEYFTMADSTVVQAKDYEYLAHYYLKNGNDSMAIVAYKQAVKAKGARAELFSEAGSFMIKKAKYDDAFEVYKLKIEKFPGTSADYYNYGRSALAKEDYVLADSIFAKVIELQPVWPNGYLMRANTNAHLDPGSTEGRALPYYEKYVSLAEADTANITKHRSGLLEAYRYLGYYYYLVKNIEKSKMYWKKVLELEPTDKQALDVIKQL